jgi:hypothetical protein
MIVDSAGELQTFLFQQFSLDTSPQSALAGLPPLVLGLSLKSFLRLATHQPTERERLRVRQQSQCWVRAKLCGGTYRRLIFPSSSASIFTRFSVRASTVAWTGHTSSPLAMRFHHITLSPGFSATFSGVPSSTRATFPRQATHVPCKTKLLPCTSPVQTVMVVMSPQWGHQTLCKIRSWKCGGIASHKVSKNAIFGPNLLPVIWTS